MATLRRQPKYSKFVRSTPGQVEVPCAGCGRPLFVFPSNLKLWPNQCCGMDCRRLFQRTLTGNKSGNWRGGFVWDDGRCRVYSPDHPRADKTNGYVYRNILVAEQKIGRRLLPGEVVHHLDENKSNDDPGNLVVVVDQVTHMRLYHGRRKGGAT
jgi:hypothetical protein